MSRAFVWVGEHRSSRPVLVSQGTPAPWADTVHHRIVEPDDANLEVHPVVAVAEHSQRMPATAPVHGAIQAFGVHGPLGWCDQGSAGHCATANARDGLALIQQALGVQVVTRRRRSLAAATLDRAEQFHAGARRRSLDPPVAQRLVTAAAVAFEAQESGDAERALRGPGENEPSVVVR